MLQHQFAGERQDGVRGHGDDVEDASIRAIGHEVGDHLLRFGDAVRPVRTGHGTAEFDERQLARHDRIVAGQQHSVERSMVGLIGEVGADDGAGVGIQQCHYQPSFRSASSASMMAFPPRAHSARTALGSGRVVSSGTTRRPAARSRSRNMLRVSGSRTSAASASTVRSLRLRPSAAARAFRRACSSSSSRVIMCFTHPTMALLSNCYHERSLSMGQNGRWSIVDHRPFLLPGKEISPGSRAAPGSATGDAAWTWSWTRSAGSAHG